MKLSKFTVVMAVLLMAILAIGAVSAESIGDADDLAKDVSAVDAISGDAVSADDAVKNNLGSAVLADGEDTPADTPTDTPVDTPTDTPSGETVYNLTDETYSTYFNEDGTPTEALSADGNYYLNVGTLTNKDIQIISGQNIYIEASEGAGIINNGTITIGEGVADEISAVQISGLTFINTNKDAIVVNQYANYVAIAQNNFDLTYDDTYAASPMAIVTYGYVDETTITNNLIKMESAAGYTYGIDLCYWLAGWSGTGDGNAEHFYVAGNEINIHSTAQSGMAEAIYIDTLANSVIEGNTIDVVTDNAGVANYGMQVADSWGFFNDPYAASPYNITIQDNTVVLDSADLAYGISVISLWPYDEDYGTIVKDMVITGNDVTIATQTEGVGICASSADVSITDNTVTLDADHDPVQAYVDSYIGNESCAIFVNNFNKDMGYYANNTVTGNTIVSNVQGIKVTKEDDNVQPLTIEDNSISYIVDDDSYATFFNEDGTATDVLSTDGDYNLLIGNLNNKDMVISSGSNINITSDIVGGIINNGTITIGEGDGMAGSIIVSGLSFANTNKDAIVVNQYSTKVTIDENNFDLTYDDTYMASPMAIVTYGYVDETTITNNVINMESAAGYTYGIDLCYWLAGWSGYGDANAEHFLVANNDINIHSTAQSGMAEAIYLDTLANSVIENNTIEVVTDNAGVANYGMQVADSWGFFNDPYAASPYNITIQDNTVVLDSADLAYGISVISLWPYDEEYETIVKDMVITGNDVTITTQTEGVGICAQSSDVSITDNTVAVEAGHNPVQAYVDSYIGNETCAIYVNNVNKDMGYYTNNTVTGNTITQGIKVANESDKVQPLVIQDNNLAYYIYDDNYADFFNEDGTIKDGTLAEGDAIVLGDLTGKKLVIDTKLDICAATDKKLVNTTINLVSGADGTTIDGLNIEFTGDDTTGSIGLIYAKDVSDIAITNNKIVVPDFVDKTGAKWGSSVYAIEIESGAGGCDNVTITGNIIDITGTARYLYGIDVFKTWGSENKNSNLNISENNVTINGGSRMAEAIYVSESDDVVIDDNIISSTSQGAAYGIATDQLTGSEIKGNDIEATSEGNMAYGITSTTAGSNVDIEGNNITATGVGAVGVGLSGQDNVNVTGNTIDITGGDYSDITSSDNLKTANAAILDKDGLNTNKIIEENALTENGMATDKVRTGDGAKELQKIIDAAEAGATVDLGNETFYKVANVKIDKDITITGGTISGDSGKVIFEIAPKSEGGPSEVNINGVNLTVRNANTIVKATGENATDGTSIDVPAINIKDNTIEAASDSVVPESVTVLELDSERPVLSPTNDIAISGNTMAAGVDPFDFKVTSVASGDDVNIVPQKIVPEKKATNIVYNNMSTTALGPSDGRTGEYFYFNLTDADGNPIANTPMQIGFNGKIYDYEHNNISTDENGTAKLQINLGYKGDYTFAICFLGDDDYNASFAVAVIKVGTQQPKLTAPNKSYSASAKTKTLTATFLTDKGNPIAGKSIKFTVNGKTYSAKTNDNGVATVKVSLNKKGTYNFTVKYGGDSTYAAVTKKAKLTIK